MLKCPTFLLNTLTYSVEASHERSGDRHLRAQSSRTVDSSNHPDYEVARALYNGMIDKRPRLIARCVDVADIIAAVAFGRDQGVLLAIRGGGHNGPGLGSCD